MAGSTPGDGDITSREEFEEALTALVAAAHSNRTLIEGCYAAWTREGMDYQVEVARDVSRDDDPVVAPNRERRPIDLGSLDVTSRASLVQTLGGLPLADDADGVTCEACDDPIGGGATATVHAVQPIEGFRWTLERTYCEDCSPASLEQPAFGRTDALVEGPVVTATGTSQGPASLLGEVRMLDHSRPDDGTI